MEKQEKNPAPLRNAARDEEAEPLKRYDDLWEEIVTFENMYDAYLEARKGRRYRSEVMSTAKRLELILHQLIFELNVGEWRPAKYYEFECRTEVKRRTINAPTFRDRIVHHSIDRVIRPLFERKYIFDSYACRLGKGTHAACTRLQHFLRQAGASGKRVYVLQADISKYYPSISHDVLKEELRRTIADKRLLEVLDLIVESFNEDTGRGLPIGSLTSQLFANVYLNPFDHFMKECRRERFYLRYMDDFIVVADDKAHLRDALADARWFIETQLKLKLNPKTAIFPASHGVDFAGYRTFTAKVLPRKRNIKAAKIRFKDLSWRFRHGKASIKDAQQVVASFLGYCKHCKSSQSARAALRRLVLSKSKPKGAKEK